MFCIKEDSPVGFVAVKVPAVVEIYKTSPTEKPEVSMPLIVPKVIISTVPFALTLDAAKPNDGILLASSASALSTVGVLPDIPEI